MSLLGKLFKGDRVIWIVFMLLCLISLVEVFSATSTIAYKNANHWAPIMRHATFLFIGFVGILIINNIPVRGLKAIGFFLPIAILLLGLTLVVGEKTNDSQRWLNIFGFSFQPSELAKISLIVFIAYILSRKNQFSETTIFRTAIISVGVTCLFIITENLSTALLIAGVCTLMMCIGGVSIVKLSKIVGALALVGIIFAFLPEEIVQKTLPDRAVTWQSRIKNFSKSNSENYKDPKTYVINNDNFQESHAKIAIARGGIFGKLPGKGQQRDFLPQAYSDFIYAIIIEETGLVGGFFVLFLYMVLIVRAGMIARKCEKMFPRYLVLGCGLLIGMQALFNMAVAVGIGPVTGIPLPLISRGGTSTIITCVYFGLMLNISNNCAHMGNYENDDESQSKDSPTLESEIADNLEQKEMVTA